MVDLDEMIERHVSKILKERYQYARSIYIFGPRESGKTTLAKEIFPKLKYVSLEDLDILEFSQTDPRGFFAQFDEQGGGIIDEPQRNPKLFSYLQGQIDNENKKFVLTSSQNFLMMESVSQSLAGRISIVNLLPLTKAEIDNKLLISVDNLFQLKKQNQDLPNIESLWPYILRGGYPEVITTPPISPQWYSDYITTYIERDVRNIINIQNLTLFQRFIKLCAGRTGNILNKSSLAADCGISESNCSRWLSLLEQSDIIILLKPYYINFGKRQVKSPKLHFLDSGLCCHLLSIKTTEHLKTHPLLGAILESYVVSEVYKTYCNNGINPALYYARDKNGLEINLIIELANGHVLPIEIKASQTVTKYALRPLIKWMELAHAKQGVLLYGGSTYQDRTNIQVVPITTF